MLRSEVNQNLLSLYKSPSYLEIGVYDGQTFDAVAAPRKVAVDVDFQFDWRAKSDESANSNVSYFETTSDDYFHRLNAGETFDLIFIDGLHTFEQTLRDLLNSVGRLRPGGVIVIDDVMPDSYPASLPDFVLCNAFRREIGDTAGSWMGDVFRLVFFIESFMPAFSYAMVSENHGQLVIWQDPRALHNARPVAEISNLGYFDAVMNLSIFRPAPFDEIMRKVRDWRAGLN